MMAELPSHSPSSPQYSALLQAADLGPSSAHFESPDHSQSLQSESESPNSQRASSNNVVEDPVGVTVQPKATPLQKSNDRLTPLRAHYLKKSLIGLQFEKELHFISSASTSPQVNSLSYLGSPFNPPPKGVPYVDLPFLKYSFRQFVLTFPFLASAPKDFFPEKLQPFIVSILSRNLSATSALDENVEATEEATRLKLLKKMQKYFALLMGSATKLVEAEEVVRLTQKDLLRLESLAQRRKARSRRADNNFDVNVVCVRVVLDKRKVRSRAHEEFIIRTRRSNHADVFVSRRYGDFKTLVDELRKMHPDETVRSPPTKDRTVVSSASTAFSMKSPSSDSFESPPSSPSGQATSFRLTRERNRLTLRAYLHSLLNSSALASSPVLKSFLLSGPTQLTPDEVEDAKRREEVDEKRDDSRKRFALEVSNRVEGLRSAMQQMKSNMIAKDGLSTLFSTIRATENVYDLPAEYKSVLEWGRISLASTIYQQFVAADDASENLASLKRIHGLVPYFVLKGILKISNPVTMIRGIMDLFLAQPFGGRSLLQRMFSSSLQEEAKALEEHIKAVKDKIQDDVLCEKVKQFVYAPKEIQEIYRADAVEEKIHILAVILRSGEQPALSRSQMQKVLLAHRAHAIYSKKKETLIDSDDDEGPEDDEAWLFEDLIILGRLYSRLRDREQMIALIFEGTTAELLKDIITIFYAPLAQVYKAASIADSLGDFQDFLNDLIRTVEQIVSYHDEPQSTVKIFIDLVQRHEQAFYSFVHKVHSKGQNLFDSLMRWIELFLSATRDGFSEKISLEYLLPHKGKEREEILQEVDAVTLYHYKLKLAYEDKLRRRFEKSQSRNKEDADAEDAATQQLVEGVVSELNFGDLLEGDANEIAAEESDGSEESYSSESDNDDDDTSSENTSSVDVSANPLNGLKESIPSTSMTSAATVSSSERQRQESNDSRAEFFSSSSKPLAHDYTGKDNFKIQSFAPPSRQSSLRSSMTKPLPPVPSSQLSPDHAQNRVNSETPKRRGQEAILKPPDLQHIPKLLPLFVEVMKPLLVPVKSSL